MAELQPTLEDWRRLYQAAKRIRELAPWEWMAETDVFAVQDPESNELGFVSVMGELGEHFAVAVYLGPQALSDFWHFQEIADFTSPWTIFELAHLQVSFEHRDNLRKKDRNIIKKLGFKFRGPRAWPMFTSYRPGFLPWDLEAWETRLLTHALEQTAEVALCFKDDSSILDTGDNNQYLTRVPHEEAGALVWKNQIVHVTPIEPEIIQLVMDFKALKEAKQLPRGDYILEVDVFMVPLQREMCARVHHICC